MATSNVDVREGGCYTDVFGIYGSGRSRYIRSEIIKSICSFYKCTSDVFRLDVMNVVAQQNADDCGVHAIAYATELAHRADPVLCSWDFENMRPHLIQCLESGVIARFPKLGERKIRFGTRVLKSKTVNILCSCRTVNDSTRAMIECVQCLKWYHKDCMNLDVAQSYSGVKWVCTACKDNMNKLS